MVNAFIISQNGHLEYEALLFVKSFLRFNSNNNVQLFVCTPRNSPIWKNDPNTINSEISDTIRDLGVKVVEFENRDFGSRYPHSNKIYAMEVLPEGEPFIFFDTDILIHGRLNPRKIDFSRMVGRQASSTWPQKLDGKYSIEQIWGSLYDRFGLETDGWYRKGEAADSRTRYPYFNAGIIYHSCPRVFSRLFIEYMLEIDRSRPVETKGQKMFPWLDQVVLPLVMNKLGASNSIGRRNHPITDCAYHYHSLASLFFRPYRPMLKLAKELTAEPDVHDLFMKFHPARELLHGESYDKLVGLTDAKAISRPELKKYLRAEGYWLRKVTEG